MEFTVSVPPAVAYGEGEAQPATPGLRPDVLVVVRNLLKGRVGKVARALNWSESTLQKKISGEGGYVFGVRDLQELQQHLGDIAPTQALASALGHVCVPVHPVEVTNLSEGTAHVLQALGDLAAAAHDANADGRGVSTNARNRVENCRAVLLGAVNAYADCAVRQAARPPGGV